MKETYLCVAKRDVLCYTAVKESLMYSRISPTNSPSFCMKSISTSLTNLAVPLPQSHYYSYYVVRGIMAPPQHCRNKPT